MMTGSNNDRGVLRQVKTDTELYQTGIEIPLTLPVVYLGDEIGIESSSDRQRHIRAVERKTRAGA